MACFVLVLIGSSQRFMWFLPTFCRVASLALGQSYDFPDKEIMTNINKIALYQITKNTANTDHVHTSWDILYPCCGVWLTPWWRHQMETFSALLAFCMGNSLATGEFPPQRPVTRRFDVFFDLGVNKRLSKQPAMRLVIWDASELIMTSLQCSNTGPLLLTWTNFNPSIDK